MTYKLHMTGVITGSLNCFCLACDVLLKCPEGATDHIGTLQHQQKANAVHFSEKFPGQHIKKFKGGYYCEFCNVLMATSSKVNVHITEDKHKQNRGALLLKPLGLDVVANGDVLIKEKAWHCLIEGVCSLCNVEFEDESAHKTDAGHSLNLVLKPIQFGADNAILRHLDETAVQCLTCNKLLAPGRMSKHFDDTEHHELFAKRRLEANGACQGNGANVICQEKAINMTSVTQNDDKIKNQKTESDANKREDQNNNEQSSTKDKYKILESMCKYQAKGININLEMETAFCKKCSEVVSFDLLEIANHIENHSSATAVDSDLLYPSKPDQNFNRVDINDKRTESLDNQHNSDVASDNLKALSENVLIDSSIPDPIKTKSSFTQKSSVDNFDNQSRDNLEKVNQEEEAKDFATANKINYNAHNQSYCRICEVRVSASLKSMREHVEGTNHKRMVASHSTRTKTPCKLVKQSTRQFLGSAYHANDILYDGTIINEKYCILHKSFHLISENSSRMRCIICEINIPPHSDIEDHIMSERHTTKFLKVSVITSEKNEFIREVLPGLYHCGYCNLVVSSWADMELHLQCSEHQSHRTIWESRLRYHLPSLQRFKIQERVEAIFMMQLLNMFQ